MSSEIKRPVRVLVAKVGLDGHDRGAKVIARALRDAVVEDLHEGGAVGPAREEEVRGLHVAVHDAGRVRCIEVATARSIPTFHIIGLPAPEVAEARERWRVEAARQEPAEIEELEVEY